MYGVELVFRVDETFSFEWFANMRFLDEPKVCIGHFSEIRGKCLIKWSKQ